MYYSVCSHEIIDTQTKILLYLDSAKASTGCGDSRRILFIAKACLIDPATARRNVKGDGNRYQYEKSLVGKGLVSEVIVDGKYEYVITEKGQAEISDRKKTLKKMVIEHDRD